MNQILSVGIEKNKKSRGKSGGTVEIRKIVRFFAIAVIIFSICLIGNGSYSIYKVGQKEESAVLLSPTIQISDISETEVKIQVEAGVNLASVTYSWDDDDEEQIECIGKKKIEQTISKPARAKKLYVYAKDINGKTIDQTKEYIRSDQENQNIEINIESDGNQIKIIASSETELSYMTYRWDDEDEERVEINDTEIEETIDVPMGEHTLTVIVVDIDNKTKTEEQKVKGVTKPTVELVGADERQENLIIKATAEDGISKIEYTRNETETTTTDLSDKPLEDRKEYEDIYPLKEGENKIKVVVYSESGVTEELKFKLTK